MSDLIKLLALEAKDIECGFQKSSIEGKGTPQEVSDRREAVVTRFLEKYFPFPFRIAKGNILDSYGNRSASIDCVVLNPDHPYTVSNGGKYSVILADGTDFAVEVKPDLSSQEEIERALLQIKTVKALTRIRDGALGSARGSPHLKKIPSIIFGTKTYSNLETLIQKIVDYYEANSIKREHQFDLVAINNRAILMNVRAGSYFFSNSPTQMPDGIVALEAGDNSLAAMLYYMHTVALSSPRMSTSVLPHYVKESDLGPIRIFPELNHRLNELEQST